MIGLRKRPGAAQIQREKNAVIDWFIPILVILFSTSDRHYAHIGLHYSFEKSVARKHILNNCFCFATEHTLEKHDRQIQKRRYKKYQLCRIIMVEKTENGIVNKSNTSRFGLQVFTNFSSFQI